MRRGSLSLVLATSLLAALVGPVSAAPGKPSATMDVSNGCAAAVYSWHNQKKGSVAQIEVRPDGVLVEVFSYPVSGASGSVTIGSFDFQAGRHYTILGVLRDAAGRAVVQSGAAWWGYCSG